ncbi:hypothetical protein HOLleu_44876 [Holothuria leucospilota]|uniref:SET domain-containing protein n=1 Tax=Holothuria leucospilota TaxID=206669 RepID=A0A9Q0Y8J3_HOLLE|nr:hypothetical protein HOLleu_44876 [Holothuria leucospilota]
MAVQYLRYHVCLCGFPIGMRRSRRKRCRPNIDGLTQEDPPGFCVKRSPGKGRGVFATDTFENGDILMVYAGELLSGEEGDKREDGPVDSVFRFFFNYNQRRWW